MITVRPDRKMFLVGGVCLVVLGAYFMFGTIFSEPDWSNPGWWFFAGLFFCLGLCLVVWGVMLLRVSRKPQMTWDGRELVVRGIFKTRSLSLDDIRQIDWPSFALHDSCIVKGEHTAITIAFSWWDRSDGRLTQLLSALHEAVSPEKQSHWKVFCFIAGHSPRPCIPGIREPDTSRGEILRTRKFYNRVTLIVFAISLPVGVALCRWFLHQAKVNAPDEPIFWWHHALIMAAVSGVSVMLPLLLRFSTPKHGRIIKPTPPALARHQWNGCFFGIGLVMGMVVVAWLLNGLFDSQTPRGIMVIVIGVVSYVVATSAIFSLWLMNGRNKIVCRLADQLPDDCTLDGW